MNSVSILTYLKKNLRTKSHLFEVKMAGKKRESRLKILKSFNCELRRFQKTSYKVLVVLLLFLLVSRFYNSGGNF